MGQCDLKQPSETQDPDQSFGTLIAYQYSLYQDQRDAQMKSMQNAQVGFNDVMLGQAEQQLQTMVESASMSLHHYPATPQLQ